MNRNRGQQSAWRAVRSLLSFCGITAVTLCVSLLPLRNSLAAGAPARGERILHLARPTDPQTLDPALVFMGADIILMPLLNLPLLDLVNGTNLVPCAALDWMCSADARTYTFHLRPELKFSNGRPVVATDCAYALERILDPKTAAPLSVYFTGIRGAREFVNARKTEQQGQALPMPGDQPRAASAFQTAHVAGIDASSPHTLVIELEQPDPTFAYVLAILFAAQPREEVDRLGATFNVRPVGSGPYVVAEWVRGVRLVFQPNPHYAGRLPRRFDRIEIMIGGDPSTHLMMFERGELDIADIEWFTLPVADHCRITRNARWRSCLEESRVECAMYVVLNTEMPPLDNPKVRQALNYAVNKPRCVRATTGRIEPARGILPPLVPGYNSNLVGYAYDPEKAKALLAASGVAQPVRLTLWHPRDFEWTMMAQAIQSDLHGIGVEVELKEVTNSELSSAMTIRRKVPMALNGWISIMPDPKDLLGSLFDGRTITNTPTTNFAFYNNPEVNRLLDLAATNITLATRCLLYGQAEELIVRDAPFIFLGYPKFFALKQPWVKGRLIEPLWPFRLDRVWIE